MRNLITENFAPAGANRLLVCDHFIVLLLIFSFVLICVTRSPKAQLLCV